MKKRILIIDGVSSGKQLAMLLIKNGHEVYHMLSGSEERYNIAEHVKKNYVAAMTDGVDYVECLHYDMSKTVVENVELLRSYGFDAVIPGTESGVWVAEVICRELGLPGNNPDTFCKRRDKYYMQKALKDAGVRSIDMLLTSSVEEALEFYRKQQNAKMIIKPCNSAGSEGVILCKSEQEVRECFLQSLNKKDFYGNANDMLLLQEYIGGREYVADSISYNGKHLLTDAHMYTKTNAVGSGGNFVYDRTSLLHSLDAFPLDYVNTALDAVGIENGLSHMELIIDEKGPVMIEVGARIIGLSCLPYMIEALGYDMAELILSAYSGDEDFEKWYEKLHYNYQPDKYLIIKSLISYVESAIQDIPAFDNLSKLKTFKGVDFGKTTNKGKIVRTRDLITSPGIVYLIGDTEESALADCLTINDWERNHPEKLFTLKDC